MKCPGSKLSLFRIMPYSEIAARGHNPYFVKKIAISEQLNDQLLMVDTNIKVNKRSEIGS